MGAGPLPAQQYGGYLLRLLQGDLGRSYILQRGVGDVLASQIWPTIQLALTAALFGVMLALVLALATAGRRPRLGGLAGLSPRYIDELLSRLFDVVATFPELLLALLVIAITGPGTGNVILAIGIAQVPNHARVIRAQTFVVRRSGYVEQTVTFGPARSALVARHVLPNVLGPLPVLATIGMGTAIIATSGLSFLGMGPQPPSPEWGSRCAPRCRSGPWTTPRRSWRSRGCRPRTARARWSTTCPSRSTPVRRSASWESRVRGRPRSPGSSSDCSNPPRGRSGWAASPGRGSASAGGVPAGPASR